MTVVVWQPPDGHGVDALHDAVVAGLAATQRAVVAGSGPLVLRVPSPVDGHGQALAGVAAGLGRSLARELAGLARTVNVVVGGHDHEGLAAFLDSAAAAWITGQVLGLSAPGPTSTAAVEGPSTVLVSGGAGDIGAAISRALHADGWQVVIGHVRPGPAQALAAELGGDTVPLDMRDPDSIAGAAGAAGPGLGAVVLCGGHSTTAPFARTGPEGWSPTLAINLLGPARLLAALPEGAAPLVVGIGSESGRIGDGGRAVYAATKAGLAALLSALSGGGRRALTIAPGPIDTPMLRGTHSSPQEAEVGIAKLARLVPLRRLGTPEDIAAAVSLALSPAGAPLGGGILSVGGGITMQ